MNDAEKLIGPNMSDEAKIAVLANAIGNLGRNQAIWSNEIKEALSYLAKEQAKTNHEMTQLKILQREQNSNVAMVKADQSEHKNWINNHTDWHGVEDRKIAERLHQEQLAEVEESSHREGIFDTLKLEWKLITIALSIIGGAAAGKIGNLLGWW